MHGGYGIMFIVFHINIFVLLFLKKFFLHTYDIKYSYYK